MSSLHRKERSQMSDSVSQAGVRSFHISILTKDLSIIMKVNLNLTLTENGANNILSK